jgi:hypothetical protein
MPWSRRGKGWDEAILVEARSRNLRCKVSSVTLDWSAADQEWPSAQVGKMVTGGGCALALAAIVGLPATVLVLILWVW